MKQRVEKYCFKTLFPSTFRIWQNKNKTRAAVQLVTINIGDEQRISQHCITCNDVKLSSVRRHHPRLLEIRCRSMRWGYGALLSVLNSRRALLLTYVGKLSMLVLLGVFCWMLAQWTWIFAAPRTDIPIHRDEAVVPDPGAARNTIAASGLFAPVGPSISTVVAAPTTLNLTLIGVLHSPAGRGASLAILSRDGKPNELFAEGREISSGVKLERIAKDHVVIRRQGLLERVDLPQHAQGTRNGKPFNLDVTRQGAGQFNFSRDALNRALQDPGQLAQLGALSVVPGEGIAIEQAPSGSLAQKLSLQPGDVVKRVNGEAVTTNEDLLRLYQKFTSTGQVTLEGVRKGAPFRQTYSVSP